jgi:hypothetical protein
LSSTFDELDKHIRWKNTIEKPERPTCAGGTIMNKKIVTAEASGGYRSRSICGSEVSEVYARTYACG